MKIKFKDMMTIIDLMQGDFEIKKDLMKSESLNPSQFLENLTSVSFKTKQFIKLILNLWYSKNKKDDRKKQASKLKYFLHRFNIEEEDQLKLDFVEILPDVNMNESKSTQNKNFIPDDSSQSDYFSQTKEVKLKSTLQNHSPKQKFFMDLERLDKSKHITSENNREEIWNNKNSLTLKQAKDYITPLKKKSKKVLKKRGKRVLDNKSDFISKLEKESQKQEYYNNKMVESIKKFSLGVEKTPKLKPKSVITIKPLVQYLSSSKKKEEPIKINLYKGPAQQISLLGEMEKKPFRKPKISLRNIETQVYSRTPKGNKEKLEKQIQIANQKVSAQNSFYQEEKQEKQIKVKTQSLQFIQIPQKEKSFNEEIIDQIQEQKEHQIDQLIEIQKQISQSNLESLKDESLLIDVEEFQERQKPKPQILKMEKQISESKIQKEYPQCNEYYSIPIILHKIQKLDKFQNQSVFQQFKKDFNKLMQELEKVNILRFKDDKKNSFIKKSSQFKPFQISIIIQKLTDLINVHQDISQTKVKMIINKSIVGQNQLNQNRLRIFIFLNVALGKSILYFLVVIQLSNRFYSRDCMVIFSIFQGVFLQQSIGCTYYMNKEFSKTKANMYTVFGHQLKDCAERSSWCQLSPFFKAHLLNCSVSIGNFFQILIMYCEIKSELNKKLANFLVLQHSTKIQLGWY